MGISGSWRGQHCSEGTKSSLWTPFQKTITKPKIPLMSQKSGKLPMPWRTQVLKQIPGLQGLTGLVLNYIQPCSVSTHRLAFPFKWGTSAGKPDTNPMSLPGFHFSFWVPAPPFPGSPRSQTWGFTFCLTKPPHFSLYHTIGILDYESRGQCHKINPPVTRPFLADFSQSS